MLPLKRELNFQGSGPPRERPERCPKSARSWGELPNPTLIDFCSILASIEDPPGTIFGTLGVILGVQKKSQKKTAIQGVKYAGPGGARRNARGSWGGLWRGQNSAERGKQKGESKQRIDQRIKPSGPTRFATLPASSRGRADCKRYAHSAGPGKWEI